MEEEQIVNKIIGERILIFRKSKKLTRTKLANILGITQQQLDKYEKGLNRISAAKLAIISKIFKIDISYFYNDLLIDTNGINKDFNNEDINLLVSYYLNIKKANIKNLIISLIQEFAENSINK